MSYTFHPAAELFPLLTEGDIETLAQDIKTHGLLEPIKLYDGQILDGRNRYRACEHAQIEPLIEVIPVTINPWEYSWSKNAERRHLPPGQKAAIFEEFVEHSTAWQAEYQRRQDDANEARQAAAQQQPRNEQGHFTIPAAVESKEVQQSQGDREDNTGGASIEAPPGYELASTTESKTSKKRKPARKLAARQAKVAGVSRATTERAKTLKRQRPDLHKQVCAGAISLNAALRQMKRETVAAPVAATAAPTGLLLLVARAECLPLPDACVDLIITSPPYNIGPKKGRQEQRNDGRSMTGGRAWSGIAGEVVLPEPQYQAWQLAVLKELYRVTKSGGSLFYNHKVRQQHGRMIHPMEWLLRVEGWTLRQEIIWDRKSTHNHERTYFWPHDERIYWLTKGTPTLPREGIQQSTVWTFHGPVADTWHVSPFPEELPRRCLAAVGTTGKIVLDPFGGSMTVCSTALALGASKVIGADIHGGHVRRAGEEHGWL